MYCVHCMSENPDDGKFCARCGKSVTASGAPNHLKPGTVLNNKYLVGVAIGEGGFGITYVGRDLTLDIKIAIKEFFPTGYAVRNNTISNEVTLNYGSNNKYYKDAKTHFLQEAQNIAKFSRERGIVNVRDFFEANGTAYIIMEYLEGENLSDIIARKGPFKADEIFRRFLPMMQTLGKMHRENVIHRDITPENIHMLPDGSLTLIDFGSARYYAGTRQRTMSVQFKQGYAPFEQYSKNGRQGPWTDVYGLCATLYKCITGKTPVDSLDRCQNVALRTPSELGVHMAPALEKVLLYGLEIYPQNRCQSMEELMRLTEAALRNEPIVTPAPGAGGAYQPPRRPVAPGNMPYPNRQNGAPVRQAPAAPKKKSHAGLIAAIIVIAVLLIGGGVLAWVLFFPPNNQNNTGSASEETTSATEASTAPASTAPTEPKATKPTQPPTQPKVTVPYLVGMKSADAYEKLSELSLKYKTEFEYSDEFPEDYIISQSPSDSSSVEQNSTVTLKISRGTKPVETTKAPEPQQSDSSSSGNGNSSSGSSTDSIDSFNIGVSTRYISRGDISWMSEDEIQLAINELYAKHGFAFGDGPVRQYFDTKSWYHPDTKDMEAIIRRMNDYEYENLKVMGAYRDEFK